MDTIKLKPLDDDVVIADIFDSNYVKGISVGKKSSSLVECLYLDTAGMDLLKNNTCYAIRYESGLFLHTMTLKNEDGATLKGEYTVNTTVSEPFPQLFPDEAIRFLRGVIGKKPLLIKYRAVYKQTRIMVKPARNVNILISRTMGSFAYNDSTECLYDVEMKLAAGTDDDLQASASAVASEFPMAPDTMEPSVFARGLNLLSQGFLSTQKARSGISGQLLARLQTLADEFIAAGTGDYDADIIHDLRVEVRKLLAFFSAASVCLPESSDQYKQYLASVIEATDKMRVADVLRAHVESEAAADPTVDFASLLAQLDDKRCQLRKPFYDSYHSGALTADILSLWGYLMGVYGKDLSDETIRKEYDLQIRKKVCKWLKNIISLQKQDFLDKMTMHAARIDAKKTRYLLGIAGTSLVRRPESYSALLVEIQDMFGHANDLEEDMLMLDEMKSDAKDAGALFAAGLLYGRYSLQAEASRKAAYGYWKNHLGTFVKLRGLMDER